jgi:hypothetical protein
MAASVTCYLRGVFASRCIQIGIAAKPRASALKLKECLRAAGKTLVLALTKGESP